MFVKTHLLSITAFLTLVTAVHCVTSRDPAFRTTSDTKLLRGPNKSVTRVDNGNLDLRPKRNVVAMNEFRKNFEDVKKTQMVNYVKNYNDLNDTFLPYNVFKCTPCVCRNISSHLVSVVCNKLSFTSIPQNWSLEISELIVNDCQSFEVLDLGNLLTYTSLTRVKVTSNSLVKVLSSSYLNVSCKIFELDLSSNVILTVENNSFILFNHLQVLSLSSNRITRLTKQTFTGLFSLHSLLVSNNVINFIANDTFDDLGNLVFLDISNNAMNTIGQDLLPVRIFIGLINLEKLYINDLCSTLSNQCSIYTNEALQVLTNLKLLRIDGRDRRGLAPEVKGLGQLRTLIIKTFTVYNFTNESYFDSVPCITTLVISGSITHNVHPKAFIKLTNLVNFTYSVGMVGKNLCHILSDIQYLLNSSLKYLTLKGVNHRYCGCKILKDEDAKYLTLFKLFELDLSNNNILDLSSGFIAMLPASLQKIDLSGNSFSSNILSKFDLLPKETIELNLNNQHYDYYECNDYKKVVDKNGSDKTFSSSTCLFSSEAVLKNSSIQQELKYNKKEHNIKMTEFSDFYLPRKLRTLWGNKFKDFGFDVMAIDLSNHSLMELNLAGGENTLWALSQVSPKIEIADFNNNYAYELNPHFFPKSSSLKYLSMSNNLFGDAFHYDPDRLFFANTKQLIALDMSQNFITDLAHDYFRNLFKLKILDMSRNKLQIINISFSHMTEIRHLDFSTNSITSISKQSRDDLDHIATDHRVYLDLTSNPLPCTCEGLELMKWLAFTNVYLLSQDFLVCRNEFDQVLEIGNIVQRVETLQHQCASKTVIILTCVFSIIVFGILLITSLLYRYRWKLRYLRNIALVKLLGSRAGATNKIVYRFDAYILYTDDTRRFVLRDCVRELEEKRGHRLCIEERDFLPGTYIVSNIVSGVQNSAKTVAMVTPEFYQGEYSEYSVKMALMEEIFMRRSVLFVCVVEPTDDKDLSHDLLTAMKQNNYIEYPPIEDVTNEIIDEFWNQFSGAIGRTDRENIDVVAFEIIQ